jgi:hypothetical protein
MSISCVIIRIVSVGFTVCVVLTSVDLPPEPVQLEPGAEVEPDGEDGQGQAAAGRQPILQPQHNTPPAMPSSIRSSAMPHRTRHLILGRAVKI